MMPDQKLQWGEHHLTGSYFSVRVSMSTPLYEKMTAKMFKIPHLTWRAGKPSKKGITKWVIYGVLHESYYRIYQTVKQEAQAKLLIEKVAQLMNQVKTRKEMYETTAEKPVPVEPVALDR